MKITAKEGKERQRSNPIKSINLRFDVWQRLKRISTETNRTMTEIMEMLVDDATVEDQTPHRNRTRRKAGK